MFGNKKLREKLKESLKSVLPITLVVLVLCFSVAPVSNSVLSAFIIGAFLLIIGMGLFTLGSEAAMQPIGESIGSGITKSRKIWLIAFIGFIIGVIVTVSEPDLQVLAGQVPSIPNFTLIIAVAIGVGLFLVVALLRVIIGIRLSYLLIGFYALVFILTLFVPQSFIAVAFDSGGVTTGPMTVPFIMALGIGVSSIRSDKHAHDDSFGLVALCSIGPIAAVLILAVINGSAGGTYTPVTIPDIDDSRELWRLFGSEIPRYLKEVAVSLAPIAVFYALFWLFSKKEDRASRKQLTKIAIGLIYTFVGLVLFLVGVNVGFMPAGNYLGTVMGGLSFNFLVIPVGMLIGYFIVAAEPAVYVLNKQVSELTSGAISERAMNISLSVGVCLSVGIAMLRVLVRIPILYILIPGYAIAIGLSFFCPKLFTAIAFDSGGVASGPLTTTFLLPFAMGVCSAVGGEIITDAFGIVAMVAMTPLITIQFLGVLYKYKQIKAERIAAVIAGNEDYAIIEL